MSVCCECCVLLGRDVCDELITPAEESTDAGASLGVI
jgi:hypothetical protein